MLVANSSSHQSPIGGEPFDHLAGGLPLRRGLPDLLGALRRRSPSDSLGQVEGFDGEAPQQLWQSAPERQATREVVDGSPRLGPARAAVRHQHRL